MSISAVGEGEKAAYYVTAGLVVLESEFPSDTGANEFYVRIVRNDPALEAEYRTAIERSKRLQRELKQIEQRIKELAADSAQDSTAEDGPERPLASSNRNLKSLQSRLMGAENRVKELARQLTGRTSTVSTSEGRVHFFDQNVGSLRVYEEDSVTVVFMEDDVFDDDLLGRKTIIIDEVLLNKGRIELNTGWVESLHLGFVPVE